MMTGASSVAAIQTGALSPLIVLAAARITTPTRAARMPAPRTARNRSRPNAIASA
jgi:hypothetical protein